MSALRDQALRALLLAAALGLWEGAVRALRIPAFILPAPSQIGIALYRGAASGVYFENSWITLAETLLGFALGAAVAFVAGTALGVRPRRKQTPRPTRNPKAAPPRKRHTSSTQAQSKTGCPPLL